ncbi:hypothetical protein Tco_0730347 [Tanacetum coccineum]|uniref:Uncharacterized protein n=1 Tax=Tanacetum coccineum TaxID=301880 RepID=A0ABQ4YSL3_9ASTR
MSTQQEIYDAGFETRPPMINKENYVPWSSRLLRYAKSRPNGKLIYNSIMNDDELTDKELKQVEADDQAIQTILLGLPGEIYAAADSCETAQEIWLRVPQMMKGSDIRIQEKKAKLFNEWEMFTSTDGESIESYYHRFSKVKTDKMQMVGGNGGNQFRHYAGQNVGNQNGYNASTKCRESGIANLLRNQDRNVDLRELRGSDWRIDSNVISEVAYYDTNVKGNSSNKSSQRLK